MTPNRLDYSQQTVEQTLESLQVDSLHIGLDDSAVEQRARKYGKNEVVIRHPWQWLKTLVEPFAN